MKHVIAIIEPENNLGTKELNDIYHDRIDDAGSNPNAHFILSHKFTFAIRYLEKKRYRNVTVYHVSDTKHSFKKKEGFSSYIELQEGLFQDSNEIINDSVLNL